MFIESRAIDDRATAGSFRTAHQRYASDTDTWFDGTPQSIDGRIARARRLVHLAKESVARRGVQTDRLAAIGSLEADIRALTALRHDLLTGAIDREDNSDIAGVRIANCGDDEEFEGGEHDEDDEDTGDQDWANVWMDHNERSKKSSLTKSARACPSCGPEHRLNHSNSCANCGGAIEGPYWIQNDQQRREVAEQNRGKNFDQGDHNFSHLTDEEREEAGRRSEENEEKRRLNERIMQHQRQENARQSSLSPEDRRYVTLESSRFLAANTDTNDVRELATRAMHFAQKVTSGASQNQSAAITTAFVQRVADGATQRRESAAHLRQGLAERPRQRTASLDSLPPEALFL